MVHQPLVGLFVGAKMIDASFDTDGPKAALQWVNVGKGIDRSFPPSDRLADEFLVVDHGMHRRSVASQTLNSNIFRGTTP